MTEGALELRVEEGPNRGAIFPLDAGERTIGREVDCDALVIDERASRKHARVVVGEGGAATIQDLGSRNGTRLNGLPLAPDAAAPLRAGDRVTIGATTFVCEPARRAVAETAGRTTVTARYAYPSGAPGAGCDPREALRVIARIGHDPVREVLREALRAAGGAEAACFARRGTTLELVATTGAPAPRPPADALETLRSADPTAAAFARAEPPGRGLAVALLGRILVVVDEPPADPATWTAIATALAPYVAAGEDARAARTEAEEARRAAVGAVEIVAESAAMRRVLDLAVKVAAGEGGVLVLGESGTGKEVVARAIHAASPRARRRFVAVNAASFPETLLESELFGHERGAFTGAVARRKGIFEVADGGTLFLDEIGEMPLALQPKLLRALESGEVRPLGAGDATRVDVRVIAATNRDLGRLVKDGRFREDLYYRLAVVELKLPPLRERAEDVEPLARALLARAGRGRAVEVEPEALDILRRYRFPGNVRELANVLERALLLGDGRTIRAADLPAEVRAGGEPPPADAEPLPTLAEMERRHIEAALRRTDGHRARAAEILGIDRKTLYHKLREEPRE